MRNPVDSARKIFTFCGAKRKGSPLSPEDPGWPCPACIAYNGLSIIRAECRQAHGPLNTPTDDTHGEKRLSASLTRRRKQAIIPLGFSLLCFLYYAAFLLRYGEMFYKGSDVVANTAYGTTLFSGVHRAGWTVPKPAQMLLFGSLYRITHDLRFVHLALILATALTVWAGCRLILRHGHSPIGCFAFCIFMMTLPRTFGTTLSGGPGCMNMMFLLLAVLCLDREDPGKRRLPALLFLSMANLTRPDSWPSTYLLVLLTIGPRLLGRRRPGLSRVDLGFLIPLAMPLAWVLVDWTVFGDPFYSAHISRAYVAEVVKGVGHAGGADENPLAAFLPHVKSSLFDLFSLSGWFSIRTVLAGLLVAAGVLSMRRKAPRTLLLIACPLTGTLLFYFVYALRGTLFRIDYIYSVHVCLIFLASVGVGSLCGQALRIPPRPIGRFLQPLLACLVLFALTAPPFQKEVLGKRIPLLKQRAALSALADEAVAALAQDVRENGGAPIILTTQWISASRISMRLGTGKDLFLVERLVSRKRLGKPFVLPPFEGRTVYFCFLNTAPESVAKYLQKLLKRASRKDLIFEKSGLVILKCSYERGPHREGFQGKRTRSR